jgi:dihydrofolate reductase
MGNIAYQTVLAFDGRLPWADKTNYVFSRQTGLADTEHIQYVTSNAVDFVTSQKQQPGGDI